jgi:hypothetical protein
MIDWFINLYHVHTNIILLFAYLMPMAFNAFEFTLRTIKEYRSDLMKRAVWEKDPAIVFYDPSLTVGHLIFRFIGTFAPFINVLAFIGNLDRVFEWIGHFFRFFWNFLEIPLVPKRGKNVKAGK